MALFVWRFIGTGLLLASLGSYAWGMRRFFSQPAGDTAGMAVIRICGAVFAVLHAGALVLTPEIAAGPLLGASLLYLIGLTLFWWAIRTNSPTPTFSGFFAGHAAAPGRAGSVSLHSPSFLLFVPADMDGRRGGHAELMAPPQLGRDVGDLPEGGASGRRQVYAQPAGRALPEIPVAHRAVFAQPLQAARGAARLAGRRTGS